MVHKTKKNKAKTQHHYALYYVIFSRKRKVNRHCLTISHHPQQNKTLWYIFPSVVKD